ncbi:MAG TPA: hypothetical protein DCG54_03120 [Anaerolineae bacterium]|nr:hypothetical protein [Anaerolineae bacterium]
MSLSSKKTNLQTWVAIWRADILVCVLGLLLGSFVLSFNAFCHGYPPGYAGMFVLMAEQIAAENFSLPQEIYFYGPGGVPFAYPPLAHYIMALAFRMGVSAWTYMRFMPAVFSLIALVPLYGLTRQLGASRWAGMAVMLIAAFSPYLYSPHTWAAGVVRAPAFGLMLIGLFFAAGAMRGVRLRRFTILAGFFFGLTILTHLGYAFAFSLWIIAWVCAQPCWKNWYIGLSIALVGILVALPWLLTILTRYGIDVFVGALSSHGTGGFLNSLGSFTSIFNYLVKTLEPIFASLPLALFFLVGLITALFHKKINLVLAFVFIALFSAESNRFVMASILPLIGYGLSFPVRRLEIFKRLFAIIGILFFAYYGFSEIKNFRLRIGGQARELAAFIQKNTDARDRYLILTPQDEAEWFPWLLQREPLIAQWGSEWLGKFDEQTFYMYQLGGCVYEDDYNCLQNLILQVGEPEMLITVWQQKHIASQLNADPAWEITYENSRYVLWERR